MVRKALTKAAKEAIAKAAAKKGRNAPQSRAISGAPEKGTVGAQKTPKAKTKSATPAKRGRPKGSTNKAKGNIQAAKTIASPTARRRNARASKVPTGVKVAAVAAPAAGLATMYTRKGKSQPTEMTFGEAFKEARAKGEGTKFTYKGKQYTAVTKDDLKKKGYKSNELKDYLNRKGKRKGLLSRIIKPRNKPIKKSGKPGSMKMAKLKAGGMATRGLGKAYMNSKR